MSFVRSLFLSFAGVILVAGAASAQNKTPPVTHPAATTHPAAPPPPVSNEPETTTASYGAWTLRCQHRKENGTEGQFCEVDQGIVPQGQQTPIAQIGVGRPGPKEEMRVTAVLPTNIIFPSTPKISNGDKEPTVDLVWRRCVPGACLADAALKEDIARNWRNEAGEDTGRLSFVDSSGRTINIHFSFRGFGQAIEALSKEK